MINYFNQTLAFLTKLIAIPSVKSEKIDGAPFGNEIKRALDLSLFTARELGFQVVDYDGFIGEVLWGDENPFAVLCHLDIVSVGRISDWKHDPFTATIENGRLYGRGAIDDKGPLAATLFAMKKLKDEGFVPKRGIKFILGCDEEGGWGCIKHYNQVAKMPEIGFSPDACFPVIYAEKGIFQANFFFDFDDRLLKEVNCGVAANVVCGYAEMKCLIDNDAVNSLKLAIAADKITSIGKTAHASEPNLGICAITPLIKYLTQINAVNRAMSSLFIEDTLNLRNINDETGSLTLTPTMLTIKHGKLCVTADIRYPATINFDNALNLLNKNFEFEILTHKRPLYNDKNSPLITTLLGVYNRHTGRNEKPIAIGGGTYARALKLGAGFGAEEEVSTAHQPNESISLKTLESLIDIYHDAIMELSFLK